MTNHHHCICGPPVLLLLLEVEGAGVGDLLGSAWASGAGAGADNSTAPRSCKTARQVPVDCELWWLAKTAIGGELPP